MRFLLMFALLFVLTGCARNPAIVAKEKNSVAQMAAAKIAGERFELVCRQVVERRRIYTLKDKETGVFYVMACYGDSIDFCPLVEKEKER